VKGGLTLFVCSLQSRRTGEGREEKKEKEESDRLSGVKFFRPCGRGRREGKGEEKRPPVRCRRFHLDSQYYLSRGKEKEGRKREKEGLARIEVRSSIAFSI